ncbi:hypothetical protein LTR10_020744 [Elasticomyces elasticus]|nr:hypothetical protein LTR10_020744 [Elasticomyces elasticus]KAK5041501.1 hypothetical protein LTR13_002166 [Exophiala sideris]
MSKGLHELGLRKNGAVQVLPITEADYDARTGDQDCTLFMEADAHDGEDEPVPRRMTRSMLRAGRRVWSGF